MVNLIQAGLVPRLGLAIGVFMLWAVFFFALVDTDADTAENVVLVPILLSSLLFGFRGGFAAAFIGMLGISTFHVIAGTDVFTSLLHEGSPPDVVLLLVVTGLVGYGRILETQRSVAIQRAAKAKYRLNQLDTESQLLAQYSIEISRSSAAKSILAAARVALAGVISFDRMAVYLVNSDKNSVTLSFLSGDDSVGPAPDDEFTIDQIMGIDPYDAALIGDFNTAPTTAPTLVLHRSISDGVEPFAYLRLWCNTARELSAHEKNHVRSVTNATTPALKRAALEAKVVYDVKMNAVVADFAAATHKSLEVSEVVEAACSYIIRGFRPDFFTIAVADSEARRLMVRQVIGEEFKGFGPGDTRSISDALADPISDEDIRIWTVDECKLIQQQSDIAQAAAESKLDSFIALNLLFKGDLLAQLWIGSQAKNGISSADVEFIRRIGQQLVSALHNANTTESLQQLQQQLVRENKRFAHMQDIVEQAESEFRIDNAQLVELSGSKTRFMSVVARELENPLALIIGYANMLRFDADKLDSEQQEFVSLIEKSGRRMEVLINDLGDVSRIESGNFSISKMPHDISKIVREIVGDIKSSILGQDRQIVYSASTDEQIFNGDPFRLGQVVTNLITNALKYSSEDGPVEITFESDLDQVRISVTDHGLGISESDQNSLFTSFFRSSNPEALECEGTGLGLVLVKSIVEQHGGELVLSSELGTGSTFTVELPVAAPDEKTAAA